jgi:SOS response regulatory protein OraA/RecX
MDENGPGEDTFAALHARAVRLLTVRMRAEAELRSRLLAGTKAAGPGDPGTVELVIARLKQARLVDDRRFAGEAARGRFEYRHQGRLRVLLELERLGIEESTVISATDEALEEAGGDEAVLVKALAKRLRVGDCPRDRKGLLRLMRHLANNGHPPDLVRQALAREFPKLFD